MALEHARTTSSRTWAGLDWLAGSVDLWSLIEEMDWRSRAPSIDGFETDVTTFEGLAAHLRAYGPKRKRDDDHTADGELVVGKRNPFVPADGIVISLVQAAFCYFFAGTGLVLAAEAAPGSFYAYRFMLHNVFGDNAGMIEIGGELTQRKGGRPSLRFELTGLGCALYEQRGDACADHAQRWLALRAKLASIDTLLSRTDIAFDDFDGTRNLALARCMYELGEFDYRFAGERKRPEAKGFEDYGSGKGSTFYVGHSSSEKQLRVYEKGKKAGDPDSPWVRWEVQLKGSTRRRVSLDVLSDPMAYMRGAFACLDFVSSCVQRLVVANEVSKATLKSIKRHVKRMYGASLYQFVRLAPSAEALLDLIEMISTDKVPRWMKNAGRLTWADVSGIDQCPDSMENNDER
ncbi:replication initiation factor domain-containing protein [Lysobacter sp. LF1]|uniref:Replication initiation factor domain-containing protein n=1 Tax=Lysobacter stagni TaxID=3045172 RepID=A0ABT6XID8_9GAMM|nr:replication initiation factor domain-containing protein [Lysobacter sp. LF1]MDI9239858.1 replication initiation factor domain-containing protein [Lysobacter sp. LF1]